MQKVMMKGKTTYFVGGVFHYFCTCNRILYHILFCQLCISKAYQQLLAWVEEGKMYLNLDVLCYQKLKEKFNPKEIYTEW